MLDRLPSEAVEALVGLRLGAASVPPVLASLVEEKTDGNPLFTEELTFALRDAGLVRVVDGRVELVSEVPDVLARRLPLTVNAAITSRIDRLSPTQQLTVKVASVIGRVFAVVILRDVHPLRGAVAFTLAGDLIEIEKADLTVTANDRTKTYGDTLVLGTSAFSKETEGMALYRCGDGGYLVAADQRATATEFEVFDRLTLDHVGSFEMQDGSGDFTDLMGRPACPP